MVQMHYGGERVLMAPCCDCKHGRDVPQPGASGEGQSPHESQGRFGVGEAAGGRRGGGVSGKDEVSVWTGRGDVGGWAGDGRGMGGGGGRGGGGPEGGRRGEEGRRYPGCKISYCTELGVP
jgi:hypothetical protein